MDGLPISVRPKQGVPKVRSALTTPWFTGQVFGVHNGSLVNVLRGLRERVFLVETPGGFEPPPKPLAGVFNKLRGFRARLLKTLGSCRPCSVEDFILTYKGAKQGLVRAAAESVAQRPITKMDAKLTTFVKAEKLNLSKKPNPAPRVIQPRDPRYNVCVGPYLKTHEHHVYQAIGEIWGGPTVMKGYNAQEVATHLRAAWDAVPNAVAIGLDASRFDQHVSVDALQWEHSVYNGMFQDPDLRRWLSWQLHNYGTCYTPEGTVSYRVDGCRMSGDMNTALGNCLLMCAMVWSLCDEVGISSLCRLANNGDDCVLILPRQFESVVRSRITPVFRQFGFTMKVEPTVHEFERIEFCQTQPVWNGRTWVMVRNPFVARSKDVLCLHTASVPYHEWLYSVGECGLALSSGIPVMQQFYLTLMRLGRKGGDRVEVSGMVYMRGKLDAVAAPISDEARLSFYRAFGVPPNTQLLIEERDANEGVHIDVGSIGADPTYLDPCSTLFIDRYG